MPRASVISIIRTALAAPVFIFLFFAGTGKLIALPEAASSVRDLRILPDTFVLPAILLISCVEVAISLSWLRNRRSLAAPALAFVLLMTFSGVYAWLLHQGISPTCSCLGEWSRYFALKIEGRQTLWRNGVFLTLLATSVACLFLEPGRGRHKGGHQGVIGAGSDESVPESRATSLRAERAGFTIIELLLVIVMIAILIALTLPTLATMHHSTRRIVSASNLRSHVQAMTLYAGDSREMAPYFTDPSATRTILRWKDLAVQSRYFDAHIFWPIVLSSGGYGASPFDRVFVGPGVRPSFISSYHYSCVFLAPPVYWDPSTRTGRSQLGPTKLSDVRFPGSKVLINDEVEFALAADRRSDPRAVVRVPPGRQNFGMVDGSVLVRDRSEPLPGYERGDGSDLNLSIHLGDTGGGLHTLGGIWGRDFKR